MALKEIRRTLKRAVDLKLLRTISSDELISMHQDDAQAIRVQATRAGLNSETRFVCDLCGHAVYAPNDKNGRPLWAHHKGAPEDCPWWTGVPTDVDSVSANQFQGAQESALHVTIKNVLAELLERDARTEPGSVVIDRYLSTENGRRRPDVRANYDGASTVIEIQLATTQIPIIIGREDFYQQEAFRLVWLTWNFEHPKPDQRLLTSFNDIFHEHAKCLFSIDADTIARSRFRRCRVHQGVLDRPGRLDLANTAPVGARLAAQRACQSAVINLGRRIPLALALRHRHAWHRLGRSPSHARCVG